MEGEIFSFQEYYLDRAQCNFKDCMVDALEKDGLVTFNNITSRQDLIALSQTLGTIVEHRDSDPDGVTRIIKRHEWSSKEGYLGFSSNYLPFHTDGSAVPKPPAFIIMLCHESAEVGGVSLLADGKQIYRVLAEEFPHLLKVLMTPNSVVFGGTEISFVSSIFSTLEDGNICIRFRYDNLGYCSEAVSAVLPRFLEIINRYSISFLLKKGQGYIIQNGRWLHGRTAFQGAREMSRVLVNRCNEIPIVRQVHLGFSPAF